MDETCVHLEVRESRTLYRGAIDERTDTHEVCANRIALHPEQRGVPAR